MNKLFKKKKFKIQCKDFIFNDEFAEFFFMMMMKINRKKKMNLFYSAIHFMNQKKRKFLSKVVIFS